MPPTQTSLRKNQRESQVGKSSHCKEELDQQGLAVVTFSNLAISPWGRVNGQFISYGLSATAERCDTCT